MTTSDEMWLYSRFLMELKKRLPDLSTHMIGSSEAGEPILGFTFGNGGIVTSLVAGAHADEPVGPNTLYGLILEIMDHPERFQELFGRFRLLIIPHVNPDGDAANASWITRWPELTPFLAGMKREPPGRDIEFGYPVMRPENRAATGFWEREAPVHLHFSLHGMQFSEGYLLLINDEWEERTRTWRRNYDNMMRDEGLQPHDHDRGGEKGFNYMGPGFTSTPKGTAMREFFLDKGDPETAALFHSSSMEHHLERNPDALCMVTEFPLFLVETSPQNGVPENYLALKQEWEKWKKEREGLKKEKEEKNEKAEKEEKRDSDPDPDPDGEATAAAERLVSRFGIRPIPLGRAMRLQRMTIRKAMDLAQTFFEKSI